jgi:hypothetical protein
MSPFPLGILAASGVGGGIAEEAVELIATATIPSETTEYLAFSGIPSTYRHLIVTGRSVRPNRSLPTLGMYFNGDRGTNYTWAEINHYGYSSIAGSTQTSNSSIYLVAHLAASAADDAVFETEILDYAHSNKLTSVRSVATTLSNDGTYRKGMVSANGIWNNTAPVTSIGIAYQAVPNYTAQLGAGSTFSLYGVKG